MTASLPLFDRNVTVWTLSWKWASKEIDCTLDGILNHCGGACCNGKAYWPPKASATGACANLGAAGCVLGNDRPVTCLLYPFRLIGDRLVLHGRTLIPKSGYCSPCYKRGGRTIAENNHGNFAILFGAAVADEIVANTKAQRNTAIKVPQEVLDALAAEDPWEAANAVPLTRQEMVGRAPPLSNPTRRLPVIE